MTTELIKEFYNLNGIGTLSELYDYLAGILGSDAIDEQFRHQVRGLQQSLKKQRFIRNIGYGLWEKI